ncbi:hypothetical protein V8V91_02435 [Algoriphagus halophilus]|uniref:hypothetical protein n=1 Tax=Algoriphagus halophilus TaxID=226505 RepID=UPI00358F0783
MFFNIQFSKAKFERLVLQYAQKRVLANENLGLGGIRIIPFDPLDFDARPEEGVIDRINLDQVELEYARGADAPRDDKVVNLPPLLLSGGREFPISSTIDIAVLQALCTISIYVVRKSDLIEAGIEGVHESKFVQFRIQVVFKVNQPQLNSNFLLLQFSPTGIRFGLGGLFADMEDIDNPVLRELGEELLEIMQENSEEWFPVVRFPVSDLEEALGGLQFWNAGIRMGSNVVDIQLQVDASDLNSTFRAGMNSFNQWETDWTDYYSNTLMDKTGSLDWGIFFPVDLFDQRIKDTVTTALAPRTDVILTRAPESNWEVSNVVRGEVGCFPGESGLLRTSIAVQLPGACIPWGYDMDVNISLNTSILIDEPGKIRLELRFSHEVDPGDVFVCGSLNAFLISSAGVVIGGAFGGWVGAVVGGVIGGLLGGFGTLGVILSQPIPSLSSPMLTRIEGEDNAYFAEIEIEPITNSILGEVAITSVTPCHNGIFAGGLLRENPGIAERLPAGNLVFLAGGNLVGLLVQKMGLLLILLLN